jgi:hypothetical protein
LVPPSGKRRICKRSRYFKAEIRSKINRERTPDNWKAARDNWKRLQYFWSIPCLFAASHYSGSATM